MTLNQRVIWPQKIPSINTVITATEQVKLNTQHPNILSTQKFCILIHLSKGMQNFCIAISAILGNFHKIPLNPSKHSEFLHLNPLEQRDAEFLHRHFCNVR